MTSIKPLKEQAMVSGEGRIGLDVTPIDRRTRQPQHKIRHEKLKYKDLTILVQKIILKNSV